MGIRQIKHEIEREGARRGDTGLKIDRHTPSIPKPLAASHNPFELAIWRVTARRDRLSPRHYGPGPYNHL